jgi:hypothetical protein
MAREIYDLPKPGFRLFDRVAPLRAKKPRKVKPNSRVVSDDPDSEHAVDLPEFKAKDGVPIDKTQEQIDMMWRYKQIMGQRQ